MTCPGSGANLSAFVLMALLENEDLYDPDTAAGKTFVSAKDKCVSFLEERVANSTDLYFLILASHALHLANSPVTDKLLDSILKLALQTEDKVHWHYLDPKASSPGTWERPNIASAIDIEMTSYMLATYALRRDLYVSRLIFNWLIEQRNFKGGFSSTQDTVVALNALSLFAELVHSFDVDIQSVVSTNMNETFQFHVNNKNTLIHQRRETNKMPSNVTVAAKGYGIAMLEMSVHFYVDAEIRDTSFAVNVTILNETNNFLLIQTCTSWLGKGRASGMTVQEIGVPSGFEPDMDSVSDMEVLKKAEKQERKVVLYFDEMNKLPVCVSVGFNRTSLVSRNHPSVVRVYDYYEPSFQTTYFYKSDLLSNLSICDICPNCFNCEDLDTPEDIQQLDAELEQKAVDDEDTLENISQPLGTTTSQP